MEKILVALSGGVDSAAAAALLQQQGYEVGGATMLLRDGGQAEAEDARLLARSLKIPFHLLDLREEFRREVMEPFMDSYRRGETPNPCVVCNRQMKFGLFLEKALALGYDGMATGHYVQKCRVGERWALAPARDGSKDQSYVLCMLRQDQLRRCHFPLGQLESKAQARALLARAGLELAGKRDSQDICFIPDGDYMAWLLEQGLQPQKGNFVDAEGRVLGPHRGLEAYTVGQRRGLGIALGERCYVLGKRGRDVILGGPGELLSRRVLLRECNWQAIEPPTEPLRVQAKLRYSPHAAEALLLPRQGSWQLLFDRPQRAVTPGQTAAVYLDNILLGGGIIAANQESEDNES